MPSLTDDSRKRLIEFAWVLQELMIDLKTAVELHRVLTEEIPKLERIGKIAVTSPPPTPLQRMSLNRFVMFPIINTLCKFIELCSAYGKEIRLLPGEVGATLHEICKNLQSREIYKFRSTYTAHALRKAPGERDRPLTLKESLDALSRVTGMDRSGEYFRASDIAAYFRSIYDANGPCIVTTIDNAVAEVSVLTDGIPSRSHSD